MQNIMLDLETMGNSPNAAIIAIGAVEFDDSGIGEKFYSVISLESSVASGGIMDASTVIWWMGQSDQARGEFYAKGDSIAVALQSFSGWMEKRGNIDDLKIWGNGAAFDNVILSSAYRRNQTKQPWMFWNDRCYRTIKALNPSVEFKRVGTHHNALSDAESQALHLLDIFKVTK